MPLPVPDSHRDLIEGAYNVVLTTLMPDGQPQMTPVWANTDGDYILLNSMDSFRKTKNMRANPRVTLFVYDPLNPLRNIEIRGRVAQMTTENAEAHLDDLTELYTGRRPFFGVCVSPDLRGQLTPVKISIVPVRVRIEGSRPGKD